MATDVFLLVLVAVVSAWVGVALLIDALGRHRHPRTGHPTEPNAGRTLAWEAEQWLRRQV